MNKLFALQIHQKYQTSHKERIRSRAEDDLEAVQIVDKITRLPSADQGKGKTKQADEDEDNDEVDNFGPSFLQTLLSSSGLHIGPHVLKAVAEVHWLWHVQQLI